MQKSSIATQIIFDSEEIGDGFLLIRFFDYFVFIFFILRKINYFNYLYIFFCYNKFKFKFKNIYTAHTNRIGGVLG